MVPIAVLNVSFIQADDADSFSICLSRAAIFWSRISISGNTSSILKSVGICFEQLASQALTENTMTLSTRAV